MGACYTFATIAQRVVPELLGCCIVSLNFTCWQYLVKMAIFSEDELMSDTLIQYCNERDSHKHVYTRTARVQINILTFTVLNPFLSIATEMLCTHHTLNS